MAVRQLLGLQRRGHALDAAKLNLAQRFTPMASPKSNGMTETFVKTIKHDYVRVRLLPDARAALDQIDMWFKDYNDIHHIQRSACARPASSVAPTNLPRCPVKPGATPVRVRTHFGVVSHPLCRDFASTLSLSRSGYKFLVDFGGMTAAFRPPPTIAAMEAE
jgi:hypothetical protein